MPKLTMHRLFSFVILLILISCNVHRTTRNPIFRSKCPVHGEILIKTRISNEGGAYCEIYFDKKKTPYPKVGICVGCTMGPPFESIIKYCPKCGD